MDCEHLTEIQAYHDAELAPPVRAEFERHLAGCAACQAELAALRRGSALLSGFAPPSLSSGAIARLHAMARDVRDRGIFRLAEVFTAAAAAVLAIGLIGLFSAPRGAARPAAWEHAMVSLEMPAPSETASTAGVAQADEQEP